MSVSGLREAIIVRCSGLREAPEAVLLEIERDQVGQVAHLVWRLGFGVWGLGVEWFIDANLGFGD